MDIEEQDIQKIHRLFIRGGVLKNKKKRKFTRPLLFLYLNTKNDTLERP